ncbi:DNA sulfur modification protein DndB [Lacrimispora celerecrescens]|uniref:DNA sulfur modification protein DndB n=1 Tax=[Clostridium] celerecrescens 18A TaxID=1286362 RepID=A0A2M8Z9I9_9FIRM|nr:DNA sulfur modification protein DndB [Lacrimispora celerecrescens]PJJ30120.1 DNA sulfur modification protein DndB [[Clostridium] celerecrescens 18A]
MDYTYKFPVVRGKQARREYYIAMVPLKMLSKLFPNTEEYVLPEYRAQRKMNESRIPVISRYITENRDSYAFSALAASIDGEFEFHESSDGLGTGILEVAMDARLLINDGQHRKAAILDALNEDASLGTETISVVLYEDLGLTRSQQLFTDLNKHAVKTSNSIAELYDSRDALAVINRNVVSRVKFLNDYTDKERDILGKFSSNLFTLNTFYTANKRIVGCTEVSDAAERFLCKFWTNIVQNIIQWNELMNHEISKVDLRENYIVTQGVVIQAFGIIGNYFYNNPQSQMEDVLLKLQSIDWKRSAVQWKLRVIRADGKIITSNKAIMLTANRIKREIGLEFSKDEEHRENQFLGSINI